MARSKRSNWGSMIRCRPNDVVTSRKSLLVIAARVLISPQGLQVRRVAIEHLKAHIRRD